MGLMKDKAIQFQERDHSYELYLEDRYFLGAPPCPRTVQRTGSGSPALPRPNAQAPAAGQQPTIRSANTRKP